MPSNQANQFLVVNFKKNHSAQFLMMMVIPDGKWVLYSDEKKVSDLSADHLTFSNISLDQTMEVNQFLDM